jgi:hypothetical protein
LAVVCASHRGDTLGEFLAVSTVEAQIVTYEISKRWKEDLVYAEAGHDNNGSLSETDTGYTSTPGRRPWVFRLGPRKNGGSLSGKHLAILMNSDERAPGRSLSDYDEWSRFIHDHQGRIGNGNSPRDAARDLKRQLDAQGIHDVDWKGGLPRQL